VSGEAAQRRVALLVEYEGTAYGGSQLQANTETVQGALERALSSLTGEPIRLALAGRTDAGVHALGQVASFVTSRRYSLDSFVRGTSSLLSGDITVRSAAEVPLDFDPRRHAVSRWYRYTIYLGRTRPALVRRFVWHVPAAALDFDSMSAAARHLIGRHDFAPFTQPSEAGSRANEREVLQAEWCRNGRMLCFDIEADAFLMQMVRRIVGALVEVGSRKRSPDDFEALVRDAAPGGAKLVAPARGLCLMKVRYENGLFDDETNEDIQPQRQGHR
jgi:tRNA pseudouridine38-40 synthase